MNQIVKNVQQLTEKYPYHSYDNDIKLCLLYLKEHEQLRFDGKYISTQDLINTKTSFESIINAKEMLNLMAEDK